MRGDALPLKCDHSLFKINNFDLIRLLASLQVAIYHAVHHLELEGDVRAILSLLKLFPGVPVFFFVSGFLISRSYERNSLLSEYGQNRALRIYPALLICTLLSVLAIYFTGYFESHVPGLLAFHAWIIGQLSILQFYNPEFMRGFGTGVLNGSLWTITVELQFYLLIPLLYSIFRRSSIGWNVVLSGLILIFAVTSWLSLKLAGTYGDSLLYKLFNVSFVPWFFMFLLGVLFQRNFESLYQRLAGNAWLVVPLYIFVAYVGIEHMELPIGNNIHPILYILLALAVFSLAYSWPGFSSKFFKGNDLSYGVYIYHMPIINMLLYYGLVGHPAYLAVAMSATFFFAICSWYFVEKPALRLKKHPLNPLKGAA